MIANNIKAYRDKVKIGQEAFSDKAWVHRTHMSLIERGQANVTIDILVKIAGAMDKDVADLVKEQKSK